MKRDITTVEEFIKQLGKVALSNDWWDIFSSNKHLRLLVLQNYLLIEILDELRKHK